MTVNGGTRENATKLLPIVLAICSAVLVAIIIVVAVSRTYIYRRKDRADKIDNNQLDTFLSEGHLTVCHARGIIVGCAGAGKTTLLKRLKGMPYKEVKEKTATKLVDVYVNSFEVLEKENTIQNVDNEEEQESLIICFYQDDIKSEATDIQSVKKERERKADLKDDCIELEQYGHPKDEVPLLACSSDKMACVQEVGGDIDKSHPNHLRTQMYDFKEFKKSESDSKVSNEISENIKRNLEKDTMSKIMDAVKHVSEKSHRRPKITFFDFAGQSMYYAFHQVYLSPKTFCILVVDMSKSPDDKPCECSKKKTETIEDEETETGVKGGTRFTDWTFRDYYKFWLKSIDSFSGVDTPVIIVGTHAENKSNAECRKFFEQFYKLFERREDIKRHLNIEKRAFAIRFPKKGSPLEDLKVIKKCIAHLVYKLPYWKETIRPTWAIFEHILQKDKCLKLISIAEISKYNEGLQNEFRMDEEEILKMLKFFNRVGSLLYIDEEGFKDTVILDVQWFLDAFKSILTYSTDMAKADKNQKRFRETGELSDEELDSIWEKLPDHGSKYFEHKKKLISFMEKLGLLAVCNSEEENILKTWYYFPSMNKRQFDEELKNIKMFNSSSILCFQFDEQGQLPIFLFYELVVKCVKIPGWSILKVNKTKSIYEKFACFSYREHIIVVCICNFQIQVQVFIPKYEITPIVCQEVQTALEGKMKEFRKYSYRVGYKCHSGALNDDKNVSFIALEEFPIKTHLCADCKVGKKHFIDNNLSWMQTYGIASSDTHLNFTAYPEENDEGYTSLKRIIQACEEGNFENFSYHLDKEIGPRKNLLLRRDKAGWNALHFAAKGGNLGIFRKLSLEKEFCLRTHEQINVLHIASKFGQYNICEYILENKYFEDILHAKSVQGKNACHYAAEGGYVKIFQLLANNGIDAISKTNDGQNVFHIACIHNKLDMCYFISNHYHYLMFEECAGKWNALLYAAKNGNTSILEFLQTKDIDFRHTSESNRNALHITCDHGHLSACEKVLEACPSLLDTVDHKGRHAGHFAVRSGNVDVLNYLFFQKADLRKETTTGMNILHMACLHSFSKMCRYILDKYPEMNSKKTARGWTTMHFVAEKGNSKGSEIEIFEMLLPAKYKGNIYALTDNHNSVLTLAVKTGDYKFVEYLLKHHHDLSKIQEANSLRALGNENPDMLQILDKYLKESGSK